MVMRILGAAHTPVILHMDENDMERKTDAMVQPPIASGRAKI
jgi:hypothetical protein